ncbi:MAG: adenylosuccinate synthetase, partial [Bdellovibrionales bacterium]|nr:adenylosuccinate synthetase [Bdellovibrionales bacterium]
KVEDVPSLASDLERVEPEYLTFDGWQADLSQVRKWHHLPQEARYYLSTLSEIVGCPISVVSVGPERQSTLFSSGGNFIRNFLV